MKKFRKLVLSAMLIVSVLMTSTSAFAATWRTGDCTSSDTNYKYCATVCLNNTKKAGYIRFHTYYCLKGKGHSGPCPKWPGAKETRGKVSLKFTTTSGKWLCEFNTTGGSKLKLGNDHSAYKIYHRLKKMNAADQFINRPECTHWAIETVSNTYIK